MAVRQDQIVLSDGSYRLNDMVKLFKNNPSVKIYPYSYGLCLPGIIFEADCPKCKNSIIVNGTDYFLSPTLANGSCEPCCPTFCCDDCELSWEEEFELEIHFDVRIVN